MVATDSGTSEDYRLGRVQSLVRAFGLLDVLGDGEALTLGEIACRTKLPRSTAHRLLTTMEALGYVRVDRANNRWLVGLQAFRVGTAFRPVQDLGGLGRPIMQALVRDVGHDVNLAVPERDGLCFVGQVRGGGDRLTAARPGAFVPLHTSASGKAVMAHWTEVDFDRFLQRNQLAPRTPRTITDPDGLRRTLADVRAYGYAVDDEEHQTGLRCVAAAVVDRFGVARGTISASDTISRLKQDRLAILGPMLRAAARRLSDEVAPQLPA